MNFLLIGIAVPIFIIVRGNGLGVEHPFRIALTIFVTFTLLSVIAILLWREIAYSVHKRTKQVMENNPDITQEYPCICSTKEMKGILIVSN